MKPLLTCGSIVLSSLLTFPVFGQSVITTVAGGGPLDNTPALSAALGCYCEVATNAAGNLYIVSSSRNRVFKVDSSGNILTVAGYDGYGTMGDGGPATTAALGQPIGLTFDRQGNFYIADTITGRIRKVDASGIITTVAGGGSGCPAQTDDIGDGCLATEAVLSLPQGIAFDTKGDFYIADVGNGRIRKVDTSGTITTVAGNGTIGFGGDGGPATSASFNYPDSVAVDSKGNLYISDFNNNRIRKVDRSGMISTFAGTGVAGYNGDGIPAATAELSTPEFVTVQGMNVYIADSGNFRVRRVNSSGKISTVAGNGTFGFGGDGGPALSAEIGVPTGITFDNSGNFYIADYFNHIRRVNSAGIISSVAGNGQFNFSGDGGPAINAEFGGPADVAADTSGNFYIADYLNYRVRKVDASGTISTVAGNGTLGFSGDGGPATSAAFDGVIAVAVDGAGNFYIADSRNQRVRKVNTAGIVSTVAGNGRQGFRGDGGPATAARLNGPISVAVDVSGNLYILDSHNDRIRRVDTSGIISTVAGTGKRGFSGDGGPAIAAKLRSPSDIAVDANQNLYIADTGNNRIRKVNTSGIISTIAGNGRRGFSGDGGPAIFAEFDQVGAVTVDGAGNLYLSDQLNYRIRKVDTSGVITTFAGNGKHGFSGDGGPATGAELGPLGGLANDSHGNLFVADVGNERVRKVAALKSEYAGKK